MIRKTLLSCFLAAFIALGAVSIAYAYITVTEDGPDEWLDPGYSWDVVSDVDD